MSYDEIYRSQQDEDFNGPVAHYDGYAFAHEYGALEFMCWCEPQCVAYDEAADVAVYRHGQTC